jgi:CheY-like chemotaxis protein
LSIRILAVDQDELQREVLCRFLSCQGFEVDAAGDAPSARRAAQTGCFDCIVMDYGLAASAGEALALGGDGAGSRLIGLSAGMDDVLTAASREADVFDVVLRKPWDPGALLHAVTQGDISPAAAGGDAAVRQPSTPAEGEAARILVVDDDDVFRQLIASALQNAGHEVLTAPNGFRALLLIRRFVFDVVLLDFNLPDLDGVAIAKLTCDLVRAPARPRLIALTATPERVAERQGLFVSHFDDIISKAAGLLPVLEAVQRCAAMRQPGSSFLKKRSKRLLRL